MLYKSERDFGDDAVLDHARNLKVLIACGRTTAIFWTEERNTRSEKQARGTLFSCLFSFFRLVARLHHAPLPFAFLRRTERRELCKIHSRGTICSCVPFWLIQASPFRAYLAPRILHSLASTRLKKAKNDACTEAYAKHLNPLKND